MQVLLGLNVVVDSFIFNFNDLQFLSSIGVIIFSIRRIGKKGRRRELGGKWKICKWAHILVMMSPDTSPFTKSTYTCRVFVRAYVQYDMELSSDYLSSLR